jgi:sugar phosphate permease
VGSIVGNLLMGLSTDILPWRSPVYMIGVVLSSLMTLTLTLWSDDNIRSISVIIFFLGAFISGSSIVIAAIECDIGKQEALKNNNKALATVSGIIDGIAGFGSILGQILIGVVKDAYGWRNTFVMLTVASLLSGVPAILFTVREV